MNTETRQANRVEIPVVGTCIRCSGLPYMAHHAHVAGGVCFQCKGVGLYMYASRKWSLDHAARAEKIALLAQMLETFKTDDEYLLRSPGRWRKWLTNEIIKVAKSVSPRDIDVYDRALAALGKVRNLNADKVAALREKILTGSVSVAA